MIGDNSPGISGTPRSLNIRHQMEHKKNPFASKASDETPRKTQNGNQVHEASEKKAKEFSKQPSINIDYKSDVFDEGIPSVQERMERHTSSLAKHPPKRFISFLNQYNKKNGSHPLGPESSKNIQRPTSAPIRVPVEPNSKTPDLSPNMRASSAEKPEPNEENKESKAPIKPQRAANAESGIGKGPSLKKMSTMSTNQKRANFRTMKTFKKNMPVLPILKKKPFERLARDLVNSPGSAKSVHFAEKKSVINYNPALPTYSRKQMEENKASH